MYLDSIHLPRVALLKGHAKVLISLFFRLLRQVFHKASKFSALLDDNEAAGEDTEQFEGEEET